MQSPSVPLSLHITLCKWHSGYNCRNNKSHLTLDLTGEKLSQRVLPRPYRTTKTLSYLGSECPKHWGGIKPHVTSWSQGATASTQSPFFHLVFLTVQSWHSECGSHRIDLGSLTPESMPPPYHVNSNVVSTEQMKDDGSGTGQSTAQQLECTCTAASSSHEPFSTPQRSLLMSTYHTTPLSDSQSLTEESATTSQSAGYSYEGSDWPLG